MELSPYTVMKACAHMHTHMHTHTTLTCPVMNTVMHCHQQTQVLTSTWAQILLDFLCHTHAHHRISRLPTLVCRDIVHPGLWIPPGTFHTSSHPQSPICRHGSSFTWRDASVQMTLLRVIDLNTHTHTHTHTPLCPDKATSLSPPQSQISHVSSNYVRANVLAFQVFPVSSYWVVPI